MYLLSALCWPWQPVLSLADRAVPTGIHLNTLSWLHSPLPSPSLSLTLEHQTGASERAVGGAGVRSPFKSQGASLRYFILSICLKFRSQVIIGSLFFLIFEIVLHKEGDSNTHTYICLSTYLSLLSRDFQRYQIYNPEIHKYKVYKIVQTPSRIFHLT